jgi:hypothetical protein
MTQNGSRGSVADGVYGLSLRAYSEVSGTLATTAPPIPAEQAITQPAYEQGRAAIWNSCYLEKIIEPWHDGSGGTE